MLHNPVKVVVGERNAAADTVEQKLIFCGREDGKLLVCAPPHARGALASAQEAPWWRVDAPRRTRAHAKTSLECPGAHRLTASMPGVRGLRAWPDGVVVVVHPQALRSMVREGIRPPVLIFVQSVERAVEVRMLARPGNGDTTP